MKPRGMAHVYDPSQTALILAQYQTCYERAGETQHGDWTQISRKLDGAWA